MFNQFVNDSKIDLGYFDKFYLFDLNNKPVNRDVTKEFESTSDNGI